MQEPENFSLDDKINDYNFEYKGYFIENDKGNEEPYLYEFGAHFSYQELYKALELLRKKQLKMQKGQKIDKIFQQNKKKVIKRDRNNTRNKNYEKENILNNIVSRFKSKGRSRNIVKEASEELTFVPKNNFKNISIQKKNKVNKSVTNNYKSKFNGINYLKIYKNKISNIKLDNKNFGKLSDKYFQLKQKNFIYKRLNLFSKNNNDINKNTSDISLQKSFQNRVNKVSKKNIKLNVFPFYPNSHTNIKKNRKLNFKEINIKTSDINQNKTSLKKIQLTGKKGVNKAIINSASLNENLGNSNSKINQNNSKDKKNNKINNSFKQLKNKEHKFISTRNNANNKSNKKVNQENLSFNNKVTISVSIENSDIKIFNSNNKPIKNKIKSMKHQIDDINKTSVIKKKNLIFPYFDGDLTNNNNKIKIKDSLNILFNNNEKNSRNKLNNFLKKISLINFNDNKTTYNNLSKVNHTQQDFNYLSKYINKFNKKLKNDKCFLFEKPPYSGSNKMKSFVKQMNNNSISNNYNSSDFIIGKYSNKKNKNINICNTNSLMKDSQKLKNLKRIKPNRNNNKRLIKKYTLKNIILNSKSISNDQKMNNSKNGLKRTVTNPEFSKNEKKIELNKNQIKDIKYQNLINNNYNNKNNININININNNNSKIIYNNNFKSNYKTNSKMNTKKCNINNNKTSKMNIKGNNDKLKNENIQKKIENNKYNKIVKFINIQFSNAKFLNIFKNDSNK